jgi:drug/metabolite transporter (DMT)-like permease
MESIGPLLGTSHHALQVVWTRYATHLALLIVVFAPLRGAALVHTPRLRLQIARGLLMLLLPLCFLAALSVSRTADVLGVFWIMPLLAMALAVWLLRERVERLRWLAALGGLAGALLVVRPGTGAILSGSRRCRPWAWPLA